MDYRREIDGLRALAVIPVILFHAGFKTFSGGFVGVDVFFVISGYLITAIILADLVQGRFSLANFYERRARRILPALVLVMGSCLVLGDLWMMPDEFKNLGQSVLATTLFSNNILLALTSGYWDLKSEFKPLLHTWSLGVEEQYYVLFPLLMMFAWRRSERTVYAVLGAILLLSLLAAGWGIAREPDVTFYILPTRAWEILLGALAAVYLSHHPIRTANRVGGQILSALGLSLIVLSVFLYDGHYPSPGLWALAPTLGALLVIVFASERTIVSTVLGGDILVGLGLISYSLYLWHQPLFAFARIYCADPPDAGIYASLCLLTLVLAYLTWRFVETPFRDRKIIGRRWLVSSALGCSLILIVLGAHLDRSYGLPGRAFDSAVKIAEMDKRIYNERVFDLKKESFSSDGRLRLLVVGNSFARDFVNMTTETFDMNNLEIVYRDDIADCILPYRSSIAERLYGDADVIVFAGGFESSCVDRDISYAVDRRKEIFYVGTKHFGYNLNWLIRLEPAQRSNQYNKLPQATIEEEREMAAAVPARHFISLLSAVVVDGRIPVTDDSGRMLSTDRMHLTRYGARFFGQHALRRSRYAAILLEP